MFDVKANVSFTLSDGGQKILRLGDGRQFYANQGNGASCGYCCSGGSDGGGGAVGGNGTAVPDYNGLGGTVGVRLNRIISY
jgi:hypothetical protein